MSDYIKTKEYKFPDGETVTAYFDEYGIAKITIQALDAIFDIFINSADRIEVVRCKDCKYWDNTTKWSVCTKWSADPYEQANTEKNDYCSYGERKDEGL